MLNVELDTSGCLREELKSTVEALRASDCTQVRLLVPKFEGLLSRLKSVIGQLKIKGRKVVAFSGREDLLIVHELSYEREQLSSWIGWLRERADPSCSCECCRSLLKGSAR